MEKKRWFFEEPAKDLPVSFHEKLAMAAGIARQIGEEIGIQNRLAPNGWNVVTCAMVAIREAGLGGFDADRRKQLKETAMEAFFIGSNRRKSRL